MASAPTNLTIPRPCAQPWQAMTPDQQGRFCTHCQKTVVDFTTMTDAQLLAHLRMSGDSDCGRFRADQLNRVLMPPSARKPGRWQWLGVVLSGWLSSQVVQAQSVVTDKRAGGTFMPVLIRSADRHSLVDTTAQGFMPDGTMILKGRVIDTLSQQPVRGATVAIRNTTYMTSTDSAGAFRLTGPAIHPDSAIQLVTSSIGYTNRELTMDMYMAGQPLLIELREDTKALNEVVYVGEYVIQKPTFWRRMRNWFRPSVKTHH